MIIRERISYDNEKIRQINESILYPSSRTPAYKSSGSLDEPFSRSLEDERFILEKKESLVDILFHEIESIILDDEFEDGEMSLSEKYINDRFELYYRDYIKDALMRVYLAYISMDNASHVLSGVLVMISSRSYDEMYPQGQTMALGLLQHKDVYIRDKAIQVFERWNSKKGIPILRSLLCDKRWLQAYVDKVIEYLERDGEE